MAATTDWKQLPDSIIDPITLEPINELAVEPFKINQHYFDGEALAAYLVASSTFENPLDRKALTRDDFKRILTEPEANLIRQNQALLATEDVTLTFTDDAIEALADAAVAANSAVENIGARRLQTVLERVLEETSFKASDLAGQTVTFDGAAVRDKLSLLTKDVDLSRFIL